jgi:hypothetical protein
MQALCAIRRRSAQLWLRAVLALSQVLTGVAIHAEDYDFPRLIQPIPETARFADPDFNIWCGSAVKGAEGRYHLYYSRWPKHLGHAAWVTHSEIARAEAPSPLGPWRHQEVIFSARGTNFWDGSCTHNPTVLQIGNQYYLYYMGNYGNGVVEKPLNWGHRNRQRIGVAVAASPTGPWQRFDSPLLDVTVDTNSADCLLVSNPSVTTRPDGGILMIYKAVGLKRPLPFGGPVVHLVALSDHPLGPFRKSGRQVFGREGVMFAAEDPFIWREGSEYRAIVKDNEGHFTGKGYSLALWGSTNGLDWKLAAHPLVTTPEIRWADGRKQRLNALERPQLLFENGQPVALFCAAADDASRAGSYNVQLPLKKNQP